MARERFSRGALVHNICTSPRVNLHPDLQDSLRRVDSLRSRGSDPIRIVIRERGVVCGRVFAENLSPQITGDWERMIKMPEFTPDARVLLFAPPDVCMHRLRVRNRDNEHYSLE